MNRTENSRERAAAIRAEIEGQRTEMSRTVGEIEERLSPAHIKEQLADLKESAVGTLEEAKDRLKADVREEIQQAKSAVHDATIGRVNHMARDARDTVTNATTTLLETIKENPIPSAMIALGLGWMFLNRQGSRRVYNEFEHGTRAGVLSPVRERGEGVIESAQETARDLGTKVSGLAHEAGERVEEFVEDAKRTGRRAARRTEIEAKRVEAKFDTVLHDNPIAVGAVALAIGAAAGLALPRTHAEDEWMGGAREKLLSRAEGVARGAIESVEEKVGALTSGEREDEAQPSVH